MSTFRAVVANEFRLLFRRRAFWVAQVLLLLPQVFVTLLLVRNALTSPLYSAPWNTSVPGILTLALIYLVVPLVLTPVVLRDLKATGELLWNSPLDPDLHLLGVFTGLWLGLLPGALLQLASWYLIAQFMTTLLSTWAWLYGLLIFLAANTLMLGLLFLLAALLRRTLPTLIGWAVLWAWAWIPVVFMEGLLETYIPPQQTALWNPFFHNLRLSPSLGLGLSADLVWGMLAWFVGLGLGALALSGLVLRRVDSRRSPRRVFLWPVLGLLPLLAAVSGVVLIGQARTAHANPTSLYDVQADTWQVLSQHTAVTVDAAAGQLAGEMTLALAARQPPAPAEIVLRLNPGLELTAATGDGAGLLVQRVGDSVVITLQQGALPQSAVPGQPITLRLAWQGSLQVPFLAFTQRWKFSNSPDLYPYTHMPLALRGLLEPQAGFLLRDGDWLPWPWSSLPHQAAESHLELRLSGAELLSPAPTADGLLILEGPLPRALLAYLTDPSITDPAITAGAPGSLPGSLPTEPPVVATRLSGSYQKSIAALFAAASQQAAARLGTAPPQTVLVLPYLNDLVWSDELLLLPDGGGPYIAESAYWMYILSLTDTTRPALQRTALWAVLRSWLLDHAAPVAVPFNGVSLPPGADLPVPLANPLSAAISPEDWAAQSGRWMQYPEVFDLRTTYAPRRRVELTTTGRWSTLAFWLAMELSPEDVRQPDMDLFAHLFSPQGILLGYGDRYRLTSARAWPGVLDSLPADRFVMDLHAWAEASGREQALTAVFGLLTEGSSSGSPGAAIPDTFWPALEQLSGVSLPEVVP